MTDAVGTGRHTRRRLSVTMALVALAAAEPSIAQEQRTPERALLFIENVLSTTPVRANLDGANTGAVTSTSHDACRTRFQFGSSGSVSIDWTTVSVVKPYSDRSKEIDIYGGLGTAFSRTELYFDTPETAQRILAAANYLRESCDARKHLGF